MKTQVRQWLTWSMVLAVINADLLAAEANQEPPPPPQVEQAPATPSPASNTNAPARSDLTAGTSTNTTPAPLIPTKLSLPPLLDQVVRLSKSGADETVVKAYIEKSAPAYRVTGNDILDLQEQGVPKNIILALVEHSKAATPAPDPEPPLTTPEAAPATNAVPEATAPLTPDVSEFYDALAPYGSWVVVPDYGWVWQPTVVVVNPSWRPYCDYGSWVWSDAGWYWNSYYSWGWAPFHYGRWFSHPRLGWCWWPDRVWGPSWVAWRSSATWCGWAPLPPGACFTAGIGWTHWGVRVGSDCDFGIRSAHFNFVAHERFTERHVARYRAAGHEANTAYAHTRVFNNYRHENNRVFNHGIGREQIAAARGRPIEAVPVSEARPQRAQFTSASVRGSHATTRNTAAVQGSGIASRGATHSAIAANRSPAAPSRSFAAQPNALGRSGAGHVASSRAMAMPQHFNRSAAAMPRPNSFARPTFHAQAHARAPQAMARTLATTPNIAPQRSLAPQRSMPGTRSFSAPTMQRSFSPRPATSAPSFRSGVGRAFSGGAPAGGMGGGRAAVAGRR